MGLFGKNRRKTDQDKLEQDIVYDNLVNDKRLSDLVIVYDEKSLILFDRPRVKPYVKKI